MNGGIDAIERDIRSHAIAWPELGKVIVATFARHIVESLGPEIFLELQIVDSDDNGTNPNHISTISRGRAIVGLEGLVTG